MKFFAYLCVITNSVCTSVKTAITRLCMFALLAILCDYRCVPYLGPLLSTYLLVKDVRGTYDRLGSLVYPLGRLERFCLYCQIVFLCVRCFLRCNGLHCVYVQFCYWQPEPFYNRLTELYQMYNSAYTGLIRMFDTLFSVCDSSLVETLLGFLKSQFTVYAMESNRLPETQVAKKELFIRNNVSFFDDQSSDAEVFKKRQRYFFKCGQNLTRALRYVAPNNNTVFQNVTCSHLENLYDIIRINNITEMESQIPNVLKDVEQLFYNTKINLPENIGIKENFNMKQISAFCENLLINELKHKPLFEMCLLCKEYEQLYASLDKACQINEMKNFQKIWYHTIDIKKKLFFGQNYVLRSVLRSYAHLFDADILNCAYWPRNLVFFVESNRGYPLSSNFKDCFFSQMDWCLFSLIFLGYNDTTTESVLDILNRTHQNCRNAALLDFSMLDVCLYQGFAVFYCVGYIESLLDFMQLTENQTKLVDSNTQTIIYANLRAKVMSDLEGLKQSKYYDWIIFALKRHLKKSCQKKLLLKSVLPLDIQSEL